MPLSSAERTTYMITCPRCRKGTQKAVAWLVLHDELPCVTPGCGNLIDLKTAENAAIIKELAENASRIDARFAENS